MTLVVQKVFSGLVICSALMHIFCCGIPLLLSIGSVSAVIGINSAELVGVEWFEAIETELFIASGALLLITGVFQIIRRQINCRTDGECTHEPCETKKDYAHKIFLMACALYSINLIIMLFSTALHSTVHFH